MTKGGHPKMKKYKLDELKDAADIVSVAESIGLQMKKRGSRYSILCPNPEHQDHHFGNCVLTRKGFKCYSCGAHGDVFDLVSDALNVSKREAYGIVADLCGGREAFVYNDIDKKTGNEKPFVKLPDKEILEFIGLMRNSADRYTCTSVYSCKKILDPYEPYEANPGEMVRYEVGKTPKSDCKVVYERIVSNPLQELANNDPDSFAELMENKAKETMETYADMIRCVQTGDKNSSFGYYCNMIAKIGGKDIFILVCKRNIEKARKIAEKYSVKTKPQNIFGKIELGAAL